MTRQRDFGLCTWFMIDLLYVVLLLRYAPVTLPAPTLFLLAHLAGILVGTMVMFTGLGGGVLWISILTFLKVNPSEAVAISIFTQVAGKGIGSFNYIRDKRVDFAVVRAFLPYAALGLVIGYAVGFTISKRSERVLLLIFAIVALYLLIQMLRSLFDESGAPRREPRPINMWHSGPLVIIASFFSGLLSIGNSDWLIPHMERSLAIPTERAVATGIVIMYLVSLLYLALTAMGILTGICRWPASTPLLFATCSGVFIGGQIGTRLVRYPFLRKRQKHAFILMLALSIIHLLW